MGAIDKLRPSIGGGIDRQKEGGLTISVVRDGNQIAFDCIGGDISNETLAAARNRARGIVNGVVSVGIVDNDCNPRPEEERRVYEEIKTRLGA